MCDNLRLLEFQFEDKELTENNDREKPQIECNICNFKCENNITLRKT